MNELELAFEERVRLLLEDEEWHKAEKLCSEKLSSFPNNAYACLGLLMAGHRISRIDKINEFPEVVNDSLYQKLLANADESLMKKLKTGFFKPEKTNSSNTPNLSEQKSFTPNPTPNNENINLTQLFKRALLALEDGDFASAYRFAENILNNDAENAQAYLIKLMIESRVKSRSDLGRLPKSFEDSGNYKKAIRFGNQELKDELNGYLEQIEHNIKYPVYARGCEEMKKGDIASLEKAISVFNSITDFKDSKNKIEECKAKIRDITYDKACEMMSESSIESNEEAIKLFASLIDLGSTFKSSGNNIEKCRLNIKKIKYNYACMAMEEKSYEKAISLFASIGDYEDSKEKLKECEKKEKISNCIPIFCILAFILFLILIPVLRPYYYRLTFYKTISEGKYEKLESLLSSSDFIDYATPEQGRKVLEFVIEHNNYDIDKKLALFDYSSFNKFGNIKMGSKIIDSILEIAIKKDNATKFSILANSKVISYLSKEQFQKLVNSILDNIAIDDNDSRYRLLENEKIKPFWNNDQPQKLLKTIAENIDSNNIHEMCEFLEKPCFKKYGTRRLGETVVASLSQLVLKSYAYEKIEFLSKDYTKQYITAEDRRAIIESIVDSGLPTDNSSLNKLFFEICNQQELESICKKIKKQGSDLPESFLGWVVDSIQKDSSPKTKALNSMIENNVSAKTYIAKQAYNNLSRYINSSYDSGYYETKKIIDAFPWVFSDRNMELMKGWKEGIDAIKQIDRDYGSSGYSAIRQLKDERSKLPSYLPLRGKILGYGGKYKNYYDGIVRECYEISMDGIYALLYTCETSFATTGYFELNVEYIDMSHVPELKGIPVLYEVPYYKVQKYDQLTEQISRLERASSTYDKSKKQTEKAIKSVKEKLVDSLYNIRIQNKRFEKHRVTLEREAENYLKSFFASNKEFMNYTKGFSIDTDNTTIQDNQKCYLIHVYNNGKEHISTVGWYDVYENGNIFDSINEKWLVSDENCVSNTDDNSNLNNKISSKIPPIIEKAIPSKKSVSEIPNNIKYKKYTNVKFGYSIDYPDFMIPNRKSDNGQMFYFDTKTYISVYADDNIDNTSINDEYLRWKRNTDDYDVIKKNWFVCSGTDESNQVYYMKKFLKNNVFYSIYFYYPVESLKAFDEIITKVTKSFKY